MPARPDTDDYRALFLNPTPMMDMRAPAEFSRGAFPCAISLPLMSDQERAQVGTCYKQRGQDAAIELGHQLVSGELKAQRVAQWVAFTHQHPRGYLYCFRGGLRSQTVQQWLRDAGVDYPLVVGGYKAMRRFLLEELERSLQAASLVLVTGKTGTGKTRVISRLASAVDLEGLANHRGSSFGQMLTAQPSQIDFENSLSIALLRLLARGEQRIFLEDEGRLIGSLALPELLREKMREAPMVVVEQSLEARIDIVLEDYVVDLGRRFTLMFGEDGARLHSEKLQRDLDKISRRLGGLRCQQVGELMQLAFERQWQTGDVSRHRHWISVLLEKYYDPMYEYQLSKRAGSRLFSGDRQAVLAWAQRDA
ncbi:MAG: tRNA 2-selenouridine(34) synthase MnmH [Halioglobus sp.]|nr:tRNA 2-selenouridine(34) synthase MnmH [Halioglobus sp.]